LVMMMMMVGGRGCRRLDTQTRRMRRRDEKGGQGRGRLRKKKNEEEVIDGTEAKNQEQKQILRWGEERKVGSTEIDSASQLQSPCYPILQPPGQTNRIPCCARCFLHGTGLLGPMITLDSQSCFSVVETSQQFPTPS